MVASTESKVEGFKEVTLVKKEYTTDCGAEDMIGVIQGALDVEYNSSASVIPLSMFKNEFFTRSIECTINEYGLADEKNGYVKKFITEAYMDDESSINLELAELEKKPANCTIYVVAQNEFGARAYKTINLVRVNTTQSEEGSKQTTTLTFFNFTEPQPRKISKETFSLSISKINAFGEATI